MPCQRWNGCKGVTKVCSHCTENRSLVAMTFRSSPGNRAIARDPVIAVTLPHHAQDKKRACRGPRRDRRFGGLRSAVFGAQFEGGKVHLTRLDGIV